MVRERIGKLLIHSCGNIWPSKKDRPTRCPGCFKKLTRDNAFKISKKQAAKIYDSIANSREVVL